MIGIDTNILVRALVDDGPPSAQAAAARNVLQQQTVFVSLVTLAETIWVLLRTYKCPKQDVAGVITALIESPDVLVQEQDTVEKALSDQSLHGGDLADHIVARLGFAIGCTTNLTFDRKAAKAPLFTLLSADPEP